MNFSVFMKFSCSHLHVMIFVFSLHKMHNRDNVTDPSSMWFISETNGRILMKFVIEDLQ